MTPEVDPNIIDNQTEAPRLSWRVLVILLATVASVAASYVMVSARVSAASARVEEMDRRGTQGLQQHISTTMDELGDLRIGQAETRKDIQAFRELMEYRLTLIESRLALGPRPARRDPAPRGDSPAAQQ